MICPFFSVGTWCEFYCKNIFSNKSMFTFGFKTLLKFTTRNKCWFHKSYKLSMETKEVTAAIVIIGDEILNGQEEEKNSNFLIKNLNTSGIKVTKVSILPDDIKLVSDEVKSLSETCSVVLTTGGIGPTHDDITYEAVARSFGEKVVLNMELSNLYLDYFGRAEKTNPSVVKFASIPESAVLNFMNDKQGNRVKFPVVSAKNVFMLPGVPLLLKRCFQIFRSTFTEQNKPLVSENLYVDLNEFYITPILNAAVEKFKDKVKFGSYPSFSENYYKVKLTMESSNLEWALEARRSLVSQLPAGCVINIKEGSLPPSIETDQLCMKFPQFSKSMDIIEEALQKYHIHEICICFTGGKDCTALLHLLHTAIEKSQSHSWNKLLSLYVNNGEPFKELSRFIQSTTQLYNLNLIEIEGDLKSAISIFMASHPEIKAAFMGTRRADPCSESLQYFSESDSDWPKIMRVSPILDWSYHDVWNFVRSLQLPYCTLYDHGFTSLGPKSKTCPNPELFVSDHGGFKTYRPAYVLKNVHSERLSRM